ncbi:MAG: hypothetical protein JWP94_1416 [Mucilaginibacter sp.]|jgi:hypothetical protein|nr:hypothetical protein [Mucilaginibacter sp.]
MKKKSDRTHAGENPTSEMKIINSKSKIRNGEAFLSALKKQLTSKNPKSKDVK